MILHAKANSKNRNSFCGFCVTSAPSAFASAFIPAQSKAAKYRQPAPMRLPSHLCPATRINTASRHLQTNLVFLLRLLRNFCAFCVRLVFFCVVAPYSSNTALIYSSCKSANPKSHHSRLRGNDGFLNLLLLGEPISVFFISVFLASAAACWHWLAQAAGTSCGL